MQTCSLNGNIRLEGGILRLPKAGAVKIRCHREIPEGYILKSVTVSMDCSGKYYASLLYEFPASESQAAGKYREGMEVLGIDFAMRGMAVFSDGSSAEYPMYYRKSQERLAREQRKLSHCKKGSRNYEKQKRILARRHEKVRNQRRDCLHKLSRRIADRYDAVAVEDIDMKAMSRCLKFGKSVMDDSYGAFRDMLRYKLGEQGKELIKVDRFFPSSKMCSRCGNVKKELRLDERIYRCGCGNCMDRDVNAAVNIREEGRRLLYGQGCKCSSEYPGGGAQALDDSIKRETGSQPEGLRKNRGARGDSLLMLSPIGLSNRKPPLLSISESGGSMSLQLYLIKRSELFRDRAT